MSERDWIELCLAGGELDDVGRVELERQIAEQPDNLELRIKHLGFLFARELPRGGEVLWLVTHHPDVDLSGFSVFPQEEDPERYDQIRSTWRNLLEGSPENSVYREQAARFATHDDPSYVEELYRQGMALEPRESKWPERLGDALMRRSRNAADAATSMSVAREAVDQFERAYELEPWDFRRHGLQMDIARASVAARLLDRASTAAAVVLRDASEFERTWQYGNSVHWGHIVLGKVALLKADVDTASTELVLAGHTPGSPQLNSYGPDLELAQGLMDLGRTEAVRDYLTQCKRFWDLDHGALDRWVAQISSNQIPKLVTT
jgi:hypothetical protein